MLRWIKARLFFVPTFLWNVLLGRLLKTRNWFDRIDDTIILGALPLERDVPDLAAQGVVAVVNTCEEYEGPVEAYQRHGITQFRVPTVDFTHPTIENVQRAVDFIEQHADRKETVYVHCKAGRARSATIALCWLIHRYGMTPEQAQSLLLQKRPHVNRHVDQRPVVREFLEREGKTP